MEGIFFYWFAWISWTYTTFIADKTKKRVATALFLLLVMIVSNEQVKLFQIAINCALILFLLMGYYLISKNKWNKLIYYFCVCLILTISFVSFKLFQIYDPVWVMFHPTFKLAIILFLLTLLLIKDQLMRIAILMIAIVQGEIVYTLFINNYVFPSSSNQLEALDIVAISVGFSFLWHGFELFVERLQNYVKQKTIIGVSNNDNM